MAVIAHNDDIEACGLTFSELEELWLGPSHNGSLFDSPEALRAAWDRGRDVVMRLWARDGKRPMGWWEFEAAALGLEFLGLDRQEQYLFERGALEEAETTELLRIWRRDFERGQKADIPPALRRRWKAERRQQNRKERPPGTIAEEAESA